MYALTVAAINIDEGFGAGNASSTHAKRKLRPVVLNTLRSGPKIQR